MLLVYRFWGLPASALVCAVAWASIRLAQRAPWRRAALEALVAGYVAALLYVVLLLPVAARPDGESSLWASVNLVPSHTILGITRDHPRMVGWQLFGNVILFVPLGVFLPRLSTRFRRLALTAAAGLCVSAGIELVQLGMRAAHVSPRTVDIDDVILNVLGACLGYVLWRAVQLPSLVPEASCASPSEDDGAGR